MFRKELTSDQERILKQFIESRISSLKKLKEFSGKNGNKNLANFLKKKSLEESTADFLWNKDILKIKKQIRNLYFLERLNCYETSELMDEYFFRNGFSQQNAMTVQEFVRNELNEVVAKLEKQNECEEQDEYTNHNSNSQMEGESDVFEFEQPNDMEIIINNFVSEQINEIRKNLLDDSNGNLRGILGNIFLSIEAFNKKNLQYDRPVFAAIKKLNLLYNISKLLPDDFSKFIEDNFPTANFNQDQVKAIKKYVVSAIVESLKPQQQGNFTGLDDELLPTLESDQFHLCQNETQDFSETTKEEDENIKRYKSGIISLEDEDNWINKSKFKDEITAIQKIANDLDHFWIPSGEDKAKNIRDALNRSVRRAIWVEATTKRECYSSFYQFKTYSQLMGSQFGQQTHPTLQNALSAQRHPEWDNYFDKRKTQSTEKLLEVERKKWIEKQSEDFKKEIERIQHHIDRLNSYFIPGGKKKAESIQAALNRAIDVALEKENIREYKGLVTKNRNNVDITVIDDFKEFHSQNEKSLNDVLALKRYSLFDNKEAESVKGEKPEVKPKK